jgi:Glycosyltransferase family 87
VTNHLIPQAAHRNPSRRLILSLVAVCILLPNFALLYSQRSGIAYRDFKIFYTGALILHANRETELYNPDLQLQLETSLLQIPADKALPYNHPPFELLLFLPLARVSYAHAFYLWVAISTCLGIISAALMASQLKRLSEYWRPLPYVLVLGTFAFLALLLQGQDSAVALLLVVLSWLALRRGADSRGGFWLGLALFKFQFFLPLVALLVFWRIKLLRGFAIAAALLLFISGVLVHPAGIGSYFHFVTHMARASSEGTNMKFGYPRLMPNLRGLIFGIASGARDVPQPTAALIALAILLLASAVIYVCAARRIAITRSNSEDTNDLVFALAVIVSSLLSFHQLTHDLAMLTLPFAIVVNRLLRPSVERSTRWFALAGIIAVFYLLPVYLFLHDWSFLYLLGAIVLAFAILVSRELADSLRETKTLPALAD